MGTRHLIAVQIDGDYKVAQYGQWDGYPSGQGVRVLAFLNDLSTYRRVAEFREKLRAAKWVDDAKLDALWKSFGARDDGMVNYEDAKKFSAVYPQFSRDTGADILSLVLNKPAGIELQSSLEFAGDSLFCEWAYVIDLDKNTLEVYEGFNEEGPVFGRFAHLNPPADEKFVPKYNGHNQYFPVRLKATFDLFNLPSEEAFLAELEPQEEEA